MVVATALCFPAISSAVNLHYALRFVPAPQKLIGSQEAASPLAAILAGLTQPCHVTSLWDGTWGSLSPMPLAHYGTTAKHYQNPVQ